MGRVVRAVALVVALLFSTAAHPATWRPDKAHSEVRFSVSHMVISEVSGRFNDFDVTLHQPGEDFSDSKVEATIKTASIDTGNERRDKHLRSDDFLNAEHYPDMIFKSTDFKKTGNDTYEIAGDLTIRDVTEPVVLHAKFNGRITDARGTSRVAFKATATINRFDFGVKWNKSIDSGGLVAGENIDITLVMELIQETKEH